MWTKMLIEVKRFEFKDTHTIGKMYVDGIYECYTLEDAVRNGTKVLGKTAIPIGTYKLIIDASTRFKQDMPHILDVPDFTGVRIHAGNTSADTDGCILLGSTWAGKDFIGNSKIAYKKFFDKLKQNKTVSITIS
jgi:hypothetical protein